MNAAILTSAGDEPPTFNPVTASVLSDNGMSPTAETWPMSVARHSGSAALRFVRGNGWSGGPIYLKVRCANTDATLAFSIIEDGTRKSPITVASTALGREHVLQINASSGSVNTIEVWAPAADGVASPPANSPLYNGSFVGYYGASPVQASQPTKRLIAIGSSIIQGKLQTAGVDRSSLGFIGQTRIAAMATGDWRFGVTAYGSRTLVGSGVTPTQLAAEVAAFGTGSSETHVWWDMTVADYAFDKVLATWQTDLGTLLDQLRAQISGTLTVHMMRHVPYPVDPGTNGNGNTLAQFRTAITTVVSTRTAYAVERDSTAAGLVSPDDYDADNIHLNTAGSTKMTTWMRSVLGV